MPAPKQWALELAAEELRQFAPAAWERFRAALQGQLELAIAGVLATAPTEHIMTCRGEARALQVLINKLNDAPSVVQRLDEEKRRGQHG